MFGELPPIDSVLDQAPCGFITFADDGQIVRVNQTLLGILGYEREELIGRHIESLLTIPGRIFYQTHFFPLLRLHGRAEEIFLLLQDRDGAQVGVLVNAVRQQDAQVVWNDCVLMLVRERRKYEDELLRARRVADSARADLQVKQDSLLSAHELLQEQARELETSRLELEAQAAELETTSEELHATNEELLLQTEELERQRAAADDANRAKTQFMATMSHELRTPLNAIAGYVQLLELGVRGPITDAQRSDLERIDRAQLHLMRLINDVLNLVRIESGHVEYVNSDFSVAELVESVLSMVEPQMQSKNIRLEVDVDRAMIAHGDFEKVQQILLNLLSNASKFTGPDGHVVVRSRYGDNRAGRVNIDVVDTGIGIAADKLPSIFDPFVQVAVGHAARREGSGLGLSISRDLARGMGGKLTVASEVGQGSTFTLSLYPGRSPPG